MNRPLFPTVGSAIPATSAEARFSWRQQVRAARLAWGRLTEDELLALDGHAGKLTSLLQERYAVSRDIAARQVASFFDTPLS